MKLISSPQAVTACVPFVPVFEFIFCHAAASLYQHWFGPMICTFEWNTPSDLIIHYSDLKINCFFVWLVYHKVIDISFLSNRTLEELVIFQLIFMLPCLIWLFSKYKRYQRYNIDQLADSFLQDNKSE